MLLRRECATSQSYALGTLAVRTAHVSLGVQIGLSNLISRRTWCSYSAIKVGYRAQDEKCQ